MQSCSRISNSISMFHDEAILCLHLVSIYALIIKALAYIRVCVLEGTPLHMLLNLRDASVCSSRPGGFLDQYCRKEIRPSRWWPFVPGNR
jgi:hypothetical protein